MGTTNIKLALHVLICKYLRLLTMTLWLGPRVNVYYWDGFHVYQCWLNKIIIFFLCSLNIIWHHFVELTCIFVCLTVLGRLYAFFRAWHPFVWVVIKWAFYYHQFGFKQQYLEILLQILRQWLTLTRLLYSFLGLRWVWVFLLHYGWALCMCD